jgi:cytidyltransferase-like protein
MTRVYVDMVADLFHFGHVEFLKQARSQGDYLVVGICSDEDVLSYKRLPICTMAERIHVVQACRYVDHVVPNAPLRVTNEILDKYEIDLVIHGDDFSEAQIKDYYGVPLARGIFRTVPYTGGISTSELLRRLDRRKADL